MFYFLLILHCTLCVFLIGLVLLQQGKGADMGATFGGSNSSTVFGAGGAADLITKVTTSLAIAFMVTSILLVRQYSVGGGIPTVVKTVDPLAGSVMEEVVEKTPDVAVEKTSNEGSASQTSDAAAKPMAKDANGSDAGTQAVEKANEKSVVDESVADKGDSPVESSADTNATSEKPKEESK